MRKIASIWCLLLIAGLGAVVTTGDARSLGLREHVVVVDGSDPRASDANTGSSASPVSTIGRGLDLATEANRRGVPVRVLILPGTYRESAILPPDPKATSAPIVIRGVGRVLMSGSDVWSGWSAESHGIYAHAWPYRWGLSPLPSAWQGVVGSYLGANPVVRRSEMVFVNGASMLQVMSRAELEATPNSFLVDEARRWISVHDSGTDLLHATVEVAVRPALLTIQSRPNVSIEHITFRHAATPLDTGAAVAVVNSRDVRLVGDRFVWNNSTGLGLSNDDGMRIDHMTANHDGVNGLTGFRLINLLVTRSEASYNGWRSVRGWKVDDHGAAIDPNFIDFAAGQKFFELRNATFRDFRAVGNLTAGLWFDSDNAGVTLQHVELVGNLTQGVMVEASQGPFSISRSWVCGNETGILVSNAANGRIEHNVLAGNLLGQLYIAGSATPRPIPVYDTGRPAHLLGANWVMVRNEIGAAAGSPAVGSLPDAELWTTFVGSFKSDRNNYSSPTTSAVFQVAGSRYVTLDEWRTETGADRHSTFSATKTKCRVPPFDELSRSPELPGSSFGVGLATVGAALAGLVLLGLAVWRLAK